MIPSREDFCDVIETELIASLDVVVLVGLRQAKQDKTHLDFYR